MTGEPESDATPEALSRSLAAMLAQGEWAVDGDPDAGAAPAPDDLEPEPEPDAEPDFGPALLFPSKVLVSDEAPPSPERIVEALLFAGGEPLPPARACELVRGLTPELLSAAVESLNRRYKAQNRPYRVERTPEGAYRIDVRPKFRPLRERLDGSPREARLSAAALDVLAVVAYRQPIDRPGLDAHRGGDCGPALRQLLRLGLVAIRRSDDPADKTQRYVTTGRFLELFGLKGLEDLPAIGDADRL